MKTLTTLIFAAFMAVSTAAFARPPEAIIDYHDVGVTTGSGKPLSANQVSLAIQMAGKNKGWSIVNRGDGKLVGRYSWKRDKHIMFVEITPANGSYSIVYRDSVNLGYAPEAAWESQESGGDEKVPVIHPFYNRYVKALIEAIRFEFLNY
jgi:hypothetical protein